MIVKRASGNRDTTLTYTQLACKLLETGIDEVWQVVLTHKKKFSETGELKLNRRKQALDWMWSLIEEGLRQRFYENPEMKNHLPKIMKAVATTSRLSSSFGAPR